MLVTCRIRQATAAAVGAILVSTLAVGCGAPRGTKAGKATGPVVLRMATRDVDFAGDPAVGYFVTRVGRLSAGALRVDVAPYWGKGRSGAEQEIARAVASGAVDLGAVGTRVFDTLGVRSFQALTAPMLIDSYRLERAVIASDLPARMLDELADENPSLTGLAVLGEGLRKPAAVERPLLVPADWRRIRFAVFRSHAAAETIRALGARPSDLWGGALSDALTSGRLQGAENDLITYLGNGRQYQAPYLTANVNLWPRTEVVLANAGRFSRLSAEQQRWLRQAAADAALRSTSMHEHDARLAALICKLSARLVEASPAQLTALRRAFAPVYANLEKDSLTESAIAEIEQLKRTTPREPELPTCPGRTPPSSSVSAQRGQSGVDGTFRFAVTDAQLHKIGLKGPYVVSQNHGIYTILLGNGRWRFHQSADNRLVYPDFSGRYRVKGDRVTFVFAVPGAPPGAPPPLTARWTLAKGQLRFTVLTGDPVVRLWFAHPWNRIG